MSSPLIYDVVAFDAKVCTSAVFHPEIEGASVDLLATFETGSEKAKRVGPSLKALSFLLMGMDHHLNDLARQVDQLVQSSQRTEGYVHKPKTKESWTGIIGRNTYGVPGSRALDTERPSAQDYIRRLRAELVSSRILQPDGQGFLQFTSDAEFESASGASCAVAGGHVNGRELFKRDGDGKTLKAVEEEDSAAADPEGPGQSRSPSSPEEGE